MILRGLGAEGTRETDPVFEAAAAGHHRDFTGGLQSTTVTTELCTAVCLPTAAHLTQVGRNSTQSMSLTDTGVYVGASE